GPVDKVLGGWQLVSLFRVSSGVPFFFRSSFCNVPDAFTAACIPAILAGAKPYLQSVNSYNPDKGPLFNSAAFEDPNSFNSYWGRGARISNLRGPGYRNHDLSLIKNTTVTEKVALQFRAEFFNVWNWHSLITSQGIKTVVYVAGSSDTFFALDARDGRVVWKRT